jgi:hypothetical protein
LYTAIDVREEADAFKPKALERVFTDPSGDVNLMIELVN